MGELEEIKKEINSIKERNSRVELDKAWEISWTRHIFIAILTFVVACIWLILINEDAVLLKGAIPTLAYILSTVSIPQLKKLWARKQIS